MAYSISKQSGQDTYGVTEFVVNEVADVATVPTDVASGSTIFVIDGALVYMLSVPVSGVKTWEPI